MLAHPLANGAELEEVEEDVEVEEDTEVEEDIELEVDDMED